jgi:hypothetical protein
LVAEVDNQLRVLEQMPVGAELAAKLFALRGEPLGCDGAVRVHALWGKVIAWASAEQMIATTEAIESLDLYVTADHLRAPLVIGQEIACATRVPTSTAMAHVTLTQKVGEDMPAAWEALDRGDWSLSHLRALALATQSCGPRVTKAVEAKIVPLALRYGWTPVQVRKQAYKLLLVLDPEGCADRAADAKSMADVTYNPLPDEVATMNAFGDAVTLRRVFDTLNARAAQMRRNGDERTIGQRRFDALAAAVLGPADHKPTAQALIAMPAATVYGENTPGEVAGYGPIAADTARRLAADAIWRKLICDPGTGEALDLGMWSYRPSAQLVRFIKARDWACRFPGCGQPAIACDCDHRVDHHEAGPTSPGNLHLLCRLHHNLKTCKIWAARLNAEGGTEWISPLGHTYYTEPHRFFDPLLDGIEPLEPDDPREFPIPNELAADPDPPWPDEPPPLSAEQFEEYLDAMDELERAAWWNANESYDRFRELGLIA